MSKNDGGPAYPPNAGWRDDDPACRGMTLRDYFATSAHHSDLAIPDTIGQCAEKIGAITWVVERDWPQLVAKLRYEFADAMLKERDK